MAFSSIVTKPAQLLYGGKNEAIWIDLSHATEYQICYCLKKCLPLMR